MEEFKKMSVWDLLMFMQKKLKNNTNIIKDNKDAISHINTIDNLTPEIQYTIKKISKLNINLTDENKRFINLINELMDIQESYRFDLSDEILGEVEKDEVGNRTDTLFFEECLERTADGDITFNDKHPFYSNQEFLHKLKELWLEREEYEKCLALKGILETGNN